MTELLDDNNLKEIFIDIQVYGNPLYADKSYRLRLRFSKMYPLEVPWVQFVSPNTGITQDETLQSTIKTKQALLKEKQASLSNPLSAPKPSSPSKFRSFLRSKHTSEQQSNASSQAPPAREGTPVDEAIALDGLPVHPHIYGNGHICLDLLGAGWSPVHTITSIAISLQSMLAGNDKYCKFHVRYV